MTNNDSLKRRVAGSKMAVELMSLVASKDIEDADFMDGLLDRLQRDFGSRDVSKDDVEAAVTPIARLGATVMPFGRYEGQAFDAIPVDYLDWLCRSQEDFYRDLRAYLKHPELEARRRSTEIETED